MIHSAPLDLDSFITSVEQAPIVEFGVFSYFYDHGYPVDSILEAYSVVNEKPQDENTAHIVVKIRTLDSPIDEADVAVDETELWCCDCKDYQYNQGVDLEDKSITEWGRCKHIAECDKSIKAENDESQATLE